MWLGAQDTWDIRPSSVQLFCRPRTALKQGESWSVQGKGWLVSHQIPALALNTSTPGGFWFVASSACLVASLSSSIISYDPGFSSPSGKCYR